MPSLRDIALAGGISVVLATGAFGEQAALQDILFSIKHIFPNVSKVGVVFSSRKEEAYRFQDLGTKEGYEVLIGAVQKAKKIRGVYNGMYQVGIKVLVLLGTDAVFDKALPFLVRVSRMDYLPVIGSKKERVKKGLALAVLKSSDGKWYIAVSDRVVAGQKTGASDYAKTSDIYVGSYALVACIWTVLTRKVVISPIEMLQRAARSISKGNLEVKMDITSRDELGSLADSMQDMAAQIKEALDTAERQRKASEDALKQAKEAQAKLQKLSESLSRGFRCYRKLWIVWPMETLRLGWTKDGTVT